MEIAPTDYLISNELLPSILEYGTQTMAKKEDRTTFETILV